jgi:segregation and condensation protein A
VIELESVPVILEGEAFSIRLPVFDGPLELLLHLIRKEELDIFDIPISRLTATYLGYLEEMRKLSVEPASEFLVMAASLMQIKSAMLLPRPPLSDDPLMDPLDPRAELVRRLLEYQRYQEVAKALDLHPRAGRDVFFRTAGIDRPPDPEDEQDLANQDIFRLAEAFRRLITKGRFTAPHDIHVERISIAERIAQIAEILARDQRTNFEYLLLGSRHREEAITTFLALLEMARLKLVRVTQGDRLGPLWVEARVGAIGTLGEDAAGMMDDPLGPTPAGRVQSGSADSGGVADPFEDPSLLDESEDGGWAD